MREQLERDLRLLGELGLELGVLETPGHTPDSLRYNPRLAGKSRAEFIELMNQLHLPRPARIDEAVPANRACRSPAQLVARAWDEARPAAGYRAAELGRLGFERAFNLEGGMLAWAAQGFDVARAGAQGA